MKITAVILSIATLIAAAFAVRAATAPDGTLQYTFSWPLSDDAALKPRGGTTRGAPVTLDRAESPAWRALQEPGLSALERDRRAILAMAGEYRVTFDFLEVMAFDAADKRNRPYQSWGTEKIYVDTDTGKSISLVHILEMRIQQEDGSLSEPMITKHWRQDWQYEPAYVVEYRGGNRWTRRKLSTGESKGSWSQTVYQVDESPRYASTGRWQHSASFSHWLSGETWRPLPRREWSVRNDYQLLIGTNRHSVHATGWLQEENNLKAVLTGQRTVDNKQPYRGREYGIARYERISGADFRGANRYYERTRQFWDEVRDAWNEVFANQGTATLIGPVDKLGLFKPLFAHADSIADAEKTTADNRQVIVSAFKAMGVTIGK